jgi:O-antigen/teichoic acid export membrane protein
MSKSFARNTVLGFSSGAAVSLAGFVANAIAARLLGPDGMGVIAYAVWCVMVAETVADLGIKLTLERFIPTLRAERRDDAVDGLIGASARVAIVSVAVACGLLLGWLYWPGRGAIGTSSSGSDVVLFGLIAGWFVCSVTGGIYLAYLRGEQRFDRFARLSALSAVIRVLATAVGAWQFGVVGALGAYFAAYSVQASHFYRLVRKRPEVERNLRRQVVRFAVAGWAATVVGGLVWGRTEIVFLEHYAGIAAVGLFAVASMLTDTAMQLPGLLLSALLPYFSEKHGLGAHEDVRRQFRLMTAVMALLMVPLCIGLAAIAPVLVPLLFGTKFADAVPVAMLLLLGAAVTTVGAATIKLINSTGKNGVLLASNASGLVCTISLGFLVIPHFGMMGAAWSRIAVQVLIVAAETWYVTRRLGYQFPLRALGAIALAATLQGVAAYGLVIKLGGVSSILLAVPVAVVVYLIALRVFAVLPAIEPTLVDSILERAPRRAARSLTWILKFVSPNTGSTPRGERR